jgi:hypothetical protein
VGQRNSLKPSALDEPATGPTTPIQITCSPPRPARARPVARLNRL